AGNVDAEMLVEAAVLGGERCLDQMVGELVERDCVVVAGAARGGFLGVGGGGGGGGAGRFFPNPAGGFPGRGGSAGPQEQNARAAQGETLRQRFDETPAPPASDMEAVHEHGEALVKLAPPGLGLVHPEVDARIEIEQEAPQPYLPAHPIVALDDVAQGSPGEWLG